MTFQELCAYCVEHADTIPVRVAEGVDGRPRSVMFADLTTTEQSLFILKWHTEGRVPRRITAQEGEKPCLT